MGRIKPMLYRALHPIRRYLGYDLINRNKFGYDAFLDIQRLSKIWGLQIDSFFDVGANDGSTVKLARSYFPQARILAFEPHPETFIQLVGGMAGRPDFEAFDLALGSQIGEAQLFEYESSDLNSLVPNGIYATRFACQRRTVLVRCTTLDGFCAAHRLDRIDVLKVDTEGYELEVLKGAGDLLSTGRIAFIYIEFNEILNREEFFGGALAPIAELITPFGYRFVATYTDRIVTEGEMLGISNALFALPRDPQARGSSRLAAK
jgi:FkbM family methyltransferase